MKNSAFSIAIACIAVAVSGCSSLVYTPAVHLSEQPLTKGKIEIQGTVGLLPETRLQDSEHKATLGGSLGAGYGFTDNISLYVSGWLAFSDDMYSRGGWSLSSRVPLLQNERYELLLYPRAALLFYGSGIDGYGAELPLVFLRRFSADVYAYAGAGFAYGTNSFDKIERPQPASGVSDSSSERVLPDGYGIIGHIGVGWNITKRLRLTGEVNPIMQINSYDDRSDVMLVPSVGVGYTIR